MELAIKNDGTILTCNKRALQAKARAYGLEGLTIVDWNDIIYGNYDAAKPLYIHKIDDTLSEYLMQDFNLKLAGYTVTMEDKND